MNFITRLKTKWGIQSNFDFFLINLIFALAGSCIMFERKPIFYFLGITAKTPVWFKILVYIPIFFPTYQMNLLIIGSLLGQHSFFWNKQKKLGRFIAGKIGFLKNIQH